MSLCIAVDARVLGEEQTGVATYTRSLLSAMAELRPETEWLLLAHRKLCHADVWSGVPPSRVRYVTIPFPTPHVGAPHFGIILLAPLVLRRERDRISGSRRSVSFPVGGEGFRRLSRFTTSRFLRLPDIQPPKYSAAWKRVLRRAARAADHAICVSEATRDDWIGLLDGRAETSSVIHEGVDLDRFTPGGGLMIPRVFAI